MLSVGGEQVIPNVVPGTHFTKIAAAGYHSLALKSDGTVVACLSNCQSVGGIVWLRDVARRTGLRGPIRQTMDSGFVQ